MFYNIIPQAKLPRNIDGIFTYSHDAELKAGELAIIEFRKTDVLGLVINKIDPAQDRKIKKVKKIAGQTPKFFVDLILWTADYYYVSPAFIFDIITPRPPKLKKFQIRKGFEIFSSSLGKNFQSLKIPKSQIEYIKKILADQSGIINTFDLALATKLITYNKLIEQKFAQNRSVIFLIPTIADLKMMLAYMPQLWKDKIILLYSDIYASKNKYWRAWQKINTSSLSSPLLILGTRSAVFAPCSNLGLIIIDKAESDDYKQYDQNPRYDARKIAMKIKELTKCEVKMFSDGICLI